MGDTFSVDHCSVWSAVSLHIFDLMMDQIAADNPRRVQIWNLLIIVANKKTQMGQKQVSKTQYMQYVQHQL